MVPKETGENWYSICWAVPLVRKQGTCLLNALLPYDAQLLMETCLELLIARTCIPEIQFIILEDVHKSKFRTKI